MSNTKTALPRSVIKVDVPRRTKDKLEEVAKTTGFSMTLIITMLVEYYLGTPLDVEHDVRRTLVRIAEENKQTLRLTERQKKVIANVAGDDGFTNELL